MKYFTSEEASLFHHENPYDNPKIDRNGNAKPVYCKYVSSKCVICNRIKTGSGAYDIVDYIPVECSKCGWNPEVAKARVAKISATYMK